MRLFAALLLCAGATLAIAQKEQREPLTESQMEQIREAGVNPDQRIALYTKFLEEHADTIKGLISRAKSTARAQRIDGELQDFTALMDELASNLDQYGERKADMRPSLKKLNEDCPKWLAILNALPSELAFDVLRKEAIEGGKDLADQASHLLAEQTAYFLAHKDEKNQQREEPR